MARSISKACLKFTGLFEAELLTELMLRFWSHPRADDADFRAAILEATAQVLSASADGQKLFDELGSRNVNFVAAMWYAESVSLSQESSVDDSERQQREHWLEAIAKALPSCFCNPDLLQ